MMMQPLKLAAPFDFESAGQTARQERARTLYCSAKLLLLLLLMMMMMMMMMKATR
jgi:hypothetical protein